METKNNSDFNIRVKLGNKRNKTVKSKGIKKFRCSICNFEIKDVNYFWIMIENQSNMKYTIINICQHCLNHGLYESEFLIGSRLVKFGLA